MIDANKIEQVKASLEADHDVDDIEVRVRILTPKGTIDISEDGQFFSYEARS